MVIMRNSDADVFTASDRAPLPEDLFSSANDGSTADAVESAGPKVLGAGSTASQTVPVDQKAAKLSDDTRQVCLSRWLSCPQ